MDYAIKIESLGKQYRKGMPTQLSNNFRQTLVHLFAESWRKWTSLGRVNEVPSAVDSESWFWALKNFHLEVPQGEVLGVIGRNGAGKSTLLKILSRITPPTTGRVHYRGRVAALLEVGTGFHRELTGRENIFLNGAILGMRRKEIARRFDEIVAFAGVEKFLDMPVKCYSSGMYIRLAFSVAAHLEADILLVDEVLAVGDAAFQKKCLGKMGSMARAGRTVIVVSHYLPSLISLCTRCVWISEGELQVSAAPASVIAAYLGSLSESGNQRDFSSPAIQRLRVTMRNQEGKDSERIFMGEGFELVLDIDPNRGFKEVQLHLFLHSSLGERISTVCTPENPEGPFPLGGRSRIRIVFPQGRLMPGDYYWRIRLWADDLLVDAERACPFTVLPKVLPGAPVYYRDDHGILFLDAKLHFEENGPSLRHNSV